MLRQQYLAKHIPNSVCDQPLTTMFGFILTTGRAKPAFWSIQLPHPHPCKHRAPSSTFGVDACIPYRSSLIALQCFAINRFLSLGAKVLCQHCDMMSQRLRLDHFLDQPLSMSQYPCHQH